MVVGILVVACKITIKEEKMWSSCMAPQGHNCPSSLLSHSQNGAYKQQNREFGLFLHSMPLSSGKSFKNPNFLNNFNSHCHIIDKIKEKCPEVIPNSAEAHQQQTQTKFTSSIPSMCLNNDNNMMLKKQRKREHHKGKKLMHAGKKSKQILQQKEIKELMQIDNSLDLANNSLDVNLCSNPQYEPRNFILEDFMAQKPLKNHAPLKKTDPIHIPISKGAEMFVMISPSPNNKSNTQFSFTDSEDSFIVFKDDDDDDNEEEIKEESPSDNKKKVQRNRYPSVCESEDSFIVFDGGDEEIEDDTSVLSTSEEESSSEDEDETEFDEVDCSQADSSYSIISRNENRKKVRFVPDEKLCEVHSMIKWSYAYQAARKGPWEMYARDRCRFKDRVFRVERDIKQIFDQKHREKIYKERFENLKN